MKKEELKKELVGLFFEYQKLTKKERKVKNCMQKGHEKPCDSCYFKIQFQDFMIWLSSKKIKVKHK